MQIVTHELWEMDGWKRADGRDIAAVVVVRALDADPRGIQREGRSVHVPLVPLDSDEDGAEDLSPASLSLILFLSIPDARCACAPIDSVGIPQEHRTQRLASSCALCQDTSVFGDFRLRFFLNQVRKKLFKTPNLRQSTLQRLSLAMLNL